eukprot:1193184-Prorocentrum_minimum.AAC.2
MKELKEQYPMHFQLLEAHNESLQRELANVTKVTLLSTTPRPQLSCQQLSTRGAALPSRPLLLRPNPSTTINVRWPLILDSHSQGRSHQHGTLRASHNTFSPPPSPCHSPRNLRESPQTPMLTHLSESRGVLIPTRRPRVPSDFQTQP